LLQAAICRDLELLKKAKINPATDNVAELLDAAAFCRNPEVVEYLLGFNPAVNATSKTEKLS
jgi:hypothetical protein